MVLTQIDKSACTPGQAYTHARAFAHKCLLQRIDWGIGDVGVYGNHATTRVQTPSIDSLARDGILFTNGYSASPVCSPSRTAWMTGRFPAEAAIHSALGGKGCAVRASVVLFTARFELASSFGLCYFCSI